MYKPVVLLTASGRLTAGPCIELIIIKKYNIKVLYSTRIYVPTRYSSMYTFIQKDRLLKL